MSPWKTEAKVVASSAASMAVGTVIAALNYGENHHALLGSLPASLQAVVLTLIPPAVTFLSGWMARHTPRTPAAAAPDDGPVTGA